MPTIESGGNGVTPLTPANGLAYSPVGGDYTAANSAQISYQIVNQDLDATTAATLTAVLNNAAFYVALSRVSTGSLLLQSSPMFASLICSSFFFFFLPISWCEWGRCEPHYCTHCCDL